MFDFLKNLKIFRNGWVWLRPTRDKNSTDYSTAYPDLGQFLGCYFHQDWDADYDTWEEGVQQFMRDATSEEVEATRKQLDHLLSRNRDESRIWRNPLHELYCDYDPTADGISYTEWLCQVRDLLNEAGKGETADE